MIGRLSAGRHAPMTSRDLALEALNWLEFSSVDGLPSQWFAMEAESQVVAEERCEQGLLDQLQAEAEKCLKCGLARGRQNVVFGTGCSDRPAIAFVGEGPGEEEDRRGEPFVGKAGALLTSAITKGMGLRREDVYICNVVKCRPPGNRAPLPEEVQACVEYLYRQLELVRPRVIVTLGQPAQRALCGLELGITKVRGIWREWRGIKVMPTFHPAYILRNPPAKREFWQDLQEVMRELNI